MQKYHKRLLVTNKCRYRYPSTQNNNWDQNCGHCVKQTLNETYYHFVQWSQSQLSKLQSLSDRLDDLTRESERAGWWGRAGSFPMLWKRTLVADSRNEAWILKTEHHFYCLLQEFRIQASFLQLSEVQVPSMCRWGGGLLWRTAET